MNESEIKRIIREVLTETNHHLYLSPETIAQQLDMDAVTIRRKCKSGELRASKFGRHWRIKRTHFDKFCKDHEL
jgi:excisionase family DNA binding protein